MSGTRAGLPPEHHLLYLPYRQAGQAEARLPAAVAIPLISGLSAVLWTVVVQVWRGLSGL